jgi:hypothetical protein
MPGSTLLVAESSAARDDLGSALEGDRPRPPPRCSGAGPLPLSRTDRAVALAHSPQELFGPLVANQNQGEAGNEGAA